MRIQMKGSSKVTIDGRTFEGSNVSIVNGKVTVDGVVQDGSLVGEINVTVEGDVEVLKNASGEVHARNVGSVQTGSGDVTCGDVEGSVSTMSGDVTCGEVGGGVTTMSGDIKAVRP